MCEILESHETLLVVGVGDYRDKGGNVLSQIDLSPHGGLQFDLIYTFSAYLSRLVVLHLGCFGVFKTLVDVCIALQELHIEGSLDGNHTECDAGIFHCVGILVTMQVEIHFVAGSYSHREKLVDVLA